jgi:hypothetical protein
MKKILAIVIMGLFFIGCGGEDNSIQSDENIKLPTVSSSFEKGRYRIFKTLDGKGKNEEDSTTDNNSDENSNDVSTEVDTDAPAQNRNIVSEPFDAIEDMFTTQYSAFPANSTHHETDNTIRYIVIDDNGIVHMIISHIAWWWGVRDNGSHENGMSRHFQYYYMSYNPKTKKKSNPQKIFENKMLNDGNLPDESIEDFIMYDNKPIIVTLNSKNHIVKRYTLDGNSKTIDTKINGKVDTLKLIKFNNKIYLTYRSLPDINIPSDWRLNAIRIYPDMGVAHKVIDKKLISYRIHNNSIFFYREGVFYTLDDDMKAISLSKEEIGKPEKYLYGKVNIYDSSVKELLLDNTFNIVILNQDNSKESTFQITDSKASINNYRSHLITASVYKDKIILVYGVHTNTDKWKMVTFNRYTKEVKSTIIGYRVDSHYSNQPFIATNKNKQLVIGNIDGGYDYSAQLTVANISSSKSTKDKILTETNNVSFGYYMGKDYRWYISFAKSSKKLTVYSLMSINNGLAGWGIVAKNIAQMDLDKNTITIDNIPNNNNGKYRVVYGNSIKTIDSNQVQSDIEKIRNSTVDIKWWFFTIDESWFIINENGNVYRFSSKEVIDGNGAKSEEYDWKKIDLDGAVPSFFVEDGVKKFRF